MSCKHGNWSGCEVCQEVEEAYARGLAAGKAEQHTAWQPIATAPKDRTAVLLYGEWAGEIAGLAVVPHIDIGRWKDGQSDFPGNDWWELVTGDAYSSWMRPTHWMPLPAPPAGELPR